MHLKEKIISSDPEVRVAIRVNHLLYVGRQGDLQREEKMCNYPFISTLHGHIRCHMSLRQICSRVFVGVHVV